MSRGTESIARHSLADEVASELRRRVLAGNFAPGDRLPTGSELSAEFGVSMSVVREAMSRLKHDGLIFSVQGAGAFVSRQLQASTFRLDTDSSPSDLVRIFELRRAIESEAASLAAQRRTPLHLERLRSALAEMETAVQQGQSGSDADARFHRVVADATGNPLFTEMYAFLATHIDLAINTARMHSVLHGTWQQAHDEHLTIFHALDASEPELAREAILQHIDSAAGRLGLELGAPVV